MTRNYNDESVDNDRKYAYAFDFDVIHAYMIESFRDFFVRGNALELGPFKGAFTKRLIPFFKDITCVEASSDAIAVAKLDCDLQHVKFISSMFETAVLENKYDNIILSHVLEHIDDRVGLLTKIKDEWLSDHGILIVACPNAYAPSRQIAVKMGIIENPEAVTPAEKEHGHRVTYSMNTLKRDIQAAHLQIIHSSGIFFKALANFQWDRLMATDIISKEYLDGCYALGKEYPNLCSTIFFVCTK